MADTQTDLREDAAATETTGAAAGFNSLKQEASNLAQTATSAIKNAANTGKDKATDALDEFARLAEDAARQVDEKLGGTMGEYARRVSTSVTDLSAGLKNKDVDELVDDATALIRNNAAAAIGIAAAAGFLLARLIKLGVESEKLQPTGERQADRD